MNYKQPIALNIADLKSITAVIIFSIILFLPLKSSADEQLFIKIKDEIKNLRDYTPKQAAIDKIEKYITQSKSNDAINGINMLLEKWLDNKREKLQKKINEIKIDGESEDWSKNELTIPDEEYDYAAYDPNQGSDTPPFSDDIKSYGFIMDDEYIKVMIEPQQSLAKDEKYYFAVDILNDKESRIYSIIWSDSRNYICLANELDRAKDTKIDCPEAIFAKKHVFEAQIPRKKLLKLPKSFSAGAVMIDYQRNYIDECFKDTGECSINDKCLKYSLELFCRYAEKADITPDNLIPLAMALTDGYIYKAAEPDLRERIVNDGIKMIKEAERTKNYSFSGQKNINELGLDAALAWSNRAIIYGGYSWIGYYIARGGIFNNAAYEFMILQPDDLEKCREIIKNNKLIEKKDLQASIKNIETWLESKQKYRRENLMDISNMYDKCPNDEYCKKIFEEGSADVNENKTIITAVNGIEINKGKNMSPSFQINYLIKNGFYYGHCVDTTTLAMAFHKALGIPSIHVQYGCLGDSCYNEVHSFPVYYSSEDEKWYNYKRGGNPIQIWAKSDPADECKVLEIFNLPQIGSFWENKTIKITNRNIGITSRNKYFIHTEDEWKKINKTGYTKAEIINLINEQIK